MNRILKTAVITLASVLVVAGTVWAQSSGFRMPDPVTEIFPNQKIEVPINTGSVAQDRKGIINFSSSTENYPLKFGTNQGISVGDGSGQLTLNGDLKFPQASLNGIVFSDNTIQTSAAYGKYKYGKFCSVVGPGWRDSFVAPDDFTIAACQKYAADTSATNGWGLGCMTPSGVVFGPGGAVPPTPNCGWPIPPRTPPPAERPCPTYNPKLDIWIQCP